MDKREILEKLYKMLQEDEMVDLFNMIDSLIEELEIDVSMGDRR